MGCGNSTDASSKGGEKSSSKNGAKAPAADKKHEPSYASHSTPVESRQPEKPPAVKSEAPLSEHIAAMSPLFVEKDGRDSRAGKDKKFLVTAVARGDGIEIGVLGSSSAGDIFYLQLTSDQLAAQVRQVAPSISAAALAQAFMAAFRSATLMLEVAASATIRIPVEGTTVTLPSLRAPPADKDLTARVFMAPMFHYWTVRKSLVTSKSESEAIRAEQNMNLLRFAAADNARARDFRRRLERMQVANGGNGRSYDPTAPGPHVYALHLDAAAPFSPRFFEHNDAAMALIRRKYADANDAPEFRASPSDGELKKLLEAVPTKQHELILATLDGVDSWSFDMFALADATNGAPLFHATYALLFKHGLVGYFRFDHATLVRFLGAIEAGYHANHYHNATHAADVLQCVHYILGPGGMITQLGLSPEEIFAALLASAMHDFGHPGFNNLFHVKTSTYLATLYNDRSVLENHHCASVFELLRHDTYNIFDGMPDDQRKEIRETIVEMVLATDMGLHSKIFSQFKTRLRDLAGEGAKGGAAWKKADDRRLALSVALKMADISNCARPSKQYLAWASRIADEFYVQGDMERELGLAMSPFMDRSKHEKDFSKGQKAFMNFIVIPLFEVGAEFLPELSFTVQTILQNKDHWDARE